MLRVTIRKICITQWPFNFSISTLVQSTDVALLKYQSSVKLHLVSCSVLTPPLFVFDLIFFFYIKFTFGVYINVYYVVKFWSMKFLQITKIILILLKKLMLLVFEATRKPMPSYLKQQGTYALVLSITRKSMHQCLPPKKT